MDIRNYLKRWSYRVGFRYGTYYQTFEGKTLSQYAVTAGFVFWAGRASISAWSSASAETIRRFGSTTGRSGWYGSAM